MAKSCTAGPRPLRIMQKHKARIPRRFCAQDQDCVEGASRDESLVTNVSQSQLDRSPIETRPSDSRERRINSDLCGQREDSNKEPTSVCAALSIVVWPLLSVPVSEDRLNSEPKYVYFQPDHDQTPRNLRSLQFEIMTAGIRSNRAVDQSPRDIRTHLDASS